ncbi:MAG: hypothetical protein ABIH57_01215 [Candidatus Omnitrophota bacterium]
MAKKIVIISVALLFISGAILAFAAQNTTAQAPQKSVFQKTSDNISAFFKSWMGSKRPLTKVFQDSHDYIIESAPRAKELSLRENPKELEKRRGE